MKILARVLYSFLLTVVVGVFVAGGFGLIYWVSTKIKNVPDLAVIAFFFVTLMPLYYFCIPWKEIEK